MDFAALPPEINSARMYTGPGSGPLIAAASAWNDMSAGLHGAAASYARIIADLAGGSWQGPAALAMTAAATPYVSWLTATAMQAAEAGARAMAAVSAYEAAFAMTVAPPVIAANRALLTALIATNVLGQNTPAIAATEAHYAEMWIQDVVAMYGYAEAAAAAAAFTPFGAPAPNADAAGLAGQAAAVARAVAGSAGAQAQTIVSSGAEMIAAVPRALQGFAGPGPMNRPGYNVLEFLADMTAFLGILDSSMGAIGTLSGFAGSAAPAADAPALGALADVGAAAATLGSAETTAGAHTVSAVLGQAPAIGSLSVPQILLAGTAAAPSPLASTAGNTGVAASRISGAPGISGMPIVGPVANSNGNGVPKYGTRPTVIVRTPAAG